MTILTLCGAFDFIFSHNVNIKHFFLSGIMNFRLY